MSDLFVIPEKAYKELKSEFLKKAEEFAKVLNSPLSKAFAVANVDFTALPDEMFGNVQPSLNQQEALIIWNKVMENPKMRWWRNSGRLQWIVDRFNAMIKSYNNKHDIVREKYPAEYQAFTEVLDSYLFGKEDSSDSYSYIDNKITSLERRISLVEDLLNSILELK